jgi:hypothetical protein
LFLFFSLLVTSDDQCETHALSTSENVKSRLKCGKALREVQLRDISF